MQTYPSVIKLEFGKLDYYGPEQHKFENVIDKYNREKIMMDADRDHFNFNWGEEGKNN